MRKYSCWKDISTVSKIFLLYENIGLELARALCINQNIITETEKVTKVRRKSGKNTCSSTSSTFSNLYHANLHVLLRRVNNCEIKVICTYKEIFESEKGQQQKK